MSWTTTNLKCCSKCKDQKTLDKFYKNKASKDGHSHDCKQCRKSAMCIRYRSNADKFRQYANDYRKRKPETKLNYHLKTRYGISYAQYAELEEKQLGVCYICSKLPSQTSRSTGKLFRLHVDHNHVTGKVRGLLCDGCNRGLSGFRDDVELLRKAIGYLEKV